MAFSMTTSPRVPVLQSGDRLTRDEFERRYDAMPHVKKAELIEGVVYMSSAVRYTQHARPEHVLGMWLGCYELATPGVQAANNSTIRLDNDNVPQPDLLLRLPPAVGGRSRITTDGYLEGAPELVVEVAASSVSYDMHQKLHAYRRHGALEYLVHRVDDGEVDWFWLERGAFVRQEPNEGMLQSRVLPRRWLHTGALLREDLRQLRAVVERGCETAEHQAFAARLASS
jgi:Uma2 family endonuclease